MFEQGWLIQGSEPTTLYDGNLATIGITNDANTNTTIKVTWYSQTEGKSVSQIIAPGGSIAITTTLVYAQNIKGMSSEGRIKIIPHSSTS